MNNAKDAGFVIIKFDGNPCTGKTLVSNSMAEFIEKLGWSVTLGHDSSKLPIILALKPK